MKEETLILCVHCKIEQPITRFREFSDEPLRIYDFCTTCTDAYGTLKLYDQHKRETTPVVARHVAKVHAADPRYATEKGRNIMAGAAARQPGVEERKVSAAEKVLQQRELMRRSLVYFTKQFLPNYKAGWVHQDICRRLEKFMQACERGESPRLLLCMPPRHGKLLADSTPVLTANRGWTTHGDLCVGDEVFGATGSPTQVIAMSSPDLATLEVETEHGVVKAHPNHEWTVYDRAVAKWRTVSTAYLQTQSLHSGPLGKRGGRYRFQLPQRAALQFPVAELPIDPYLLGVWLGDGKSEDGSFCYAEQDKEVYCSVVAAGFTPTWGAVHASTGVNYSGSKFLTRALKPLGVLRNKHIPQAYLLASITQRLELLAGLIDTDGHVERKSGRVRIATVSSQLRDGIMELVRSLGWEPYCYTQAPTLSSSGIQGTRPCHYVGFQPTVSVPTRLPRKDILAFAKPRRAAIKAVRATSPEIGRCIQVAATDGLYLAGRELIPTHNSELASIRFPAWLLGHHPEWEVIHACNAVSLTEEFSRKIKDCILAPEYEAVFDRLKLRKDVQNLQRWLTDKGGGYLAAGVGTGILGKGANVLIIDDPVKDEQAADSEAQRQGVMDWYTGVAASRLAPGAGVVVIMQRWHDLDLAGRLLKLQRELEESGVDPAVIEKWELVEYTMEAEQDEYLFADGSIQAGPAFVPDNARLLRNKGDPLHPDRYNTLEMNRIKHRLLRTNPRHWHALYQQKPVPDEGEFFQTSMFRYEPLVPDYSAMRILSAWDLAIGIKQANDWTVGIVAGLDFDDRLHILDMLRFKGGTLEIVDAMITVMKRYQPFSFGIEHGQISLSVMGPLRQAMLRPENRCYTQIDETLKPITDKQARAKPLQGRMQAGSVIFPQNQPWVDKLRAEFLRFPNGENDDMVDAMAWLARMAQNVPAPARPVPTKIKSWRDDLGQYVVGNHKSHMSA